MGGTVTRTHCPQLDFPATKIVVSDKSSRSDHATAQVLHTTIILDDTLLATTTNQDEILAVIAHEIGH